MFDALLFAMLYIHLDVPVHKGDKELNTDDLNFDEAVPRQICLHYRPTVAMFGVFKQGAVLLVQPAADHHGFTFGVPQGGIDYKRGETIRQALKREIQEELPGIVLGAQELISGEVNRVPPERKTRDKWIYFALCEIVRFPDTVNKAENKGLCKIWNPDDLFFALDDARPNKARMIFHAAEKAVSKGALHWDMQPVQRYLRILEDEAKAA